MNKRILSLLMFFLMLHLAVQPALSIHYCEGQLRTVSSFGDPKSCCGYVANNMQNQHEAQPMLREAPCCSNSHYNIASDQNKTSIHEVEAPRCIYTGVSFIVSPIYSLAFETRSVSQNHAPPQRVVNNKAVFLSLMCRYII